MREKSADRKAKKELKSKNKGIIVQLPELNIEKQKQSNKSIQIISKEPINEPVEQINDGVEQIELLTINIKLPQVNSDDEISISNNYQELIIDLNQTGN
jgi:hypothetical protein